MSAWRRRAVGVETWRPRPVVANAGPGQGGFEPMLPAQVGLTIESERECQRLIDGGNAPLDLDAAGVARQNPQHVRAPHVLAAVLPPAAANAALAAGPKLDRRVHRPLQQLAVEVGSAEAQQAAIGADLREEPPVSDGGDKARAHTVAERLRPARLMTVAMRSAPRAFSISSRD